MNIVSTASVLPCTVGDINSILTVVFVGHKKFDPKRLGNFFRVWKSKIWNFLLYLKKNNKLYHNIILNPFNLNSYPTDDSLPGIQDCVVYVGDSPYILIGSAGTELKAKNIYKKGHKSLKTQFLTCIY